MKPILIVIGGIFAALLLASAARELTPAPFDPVLYERQQIAIEQMRAIAPYQTFAAGVLALAPALALVLTIILLAAWGSVALIRFRHERQPDSRGLLPVNAYRLDEVSPVALGAYHGARQIEAGRQPVPHTISYAPSGHYAPRLDYRADTERAALPLADEPAPELAQQLPGVIDLAALSFTPSKEAILLGLAEGNELITVPMKALWHIGTAGPTGAGKSNIARLILPQLLALGAQVAIIDPKWTPFDAESGEDWRPIGDRLFTPAARTPAAIGDTIGYFHDELERRLELRNAGQKVGGPLFLYADEFTTITTDVKDASERVARLARLGRGVGIFLLIAAHDLLVKNGSGDTRDQLRTGYYLGGDTKTGSVLLDLPQRQVIEREGDLVIGVAMLRSAATSPARLVRVPYASNAGITALLGAATVSRPEAGPVSRPMGFRGPASEGAAAGARPGTGPDTGPAKASASGRATAPQKSSDAETLRILARFRAGATIHDLASDLAGTTNPGDRRYKAARERVEAMLRQLAVDEGGDDDQRRA